MHSKEEFRAVTSHYSGHVRLTGVIFNPCLYKRECPRAGLEELTILVFLCLTNQENWKFDGIIISETLGSLTKF